MREEDFLAMKKKKKKMKAVEDEAAGEPVPYDIAPRRAGDPVSTYADPTLAETTLGWRARYGLKDIVESAYTWHRSQVKLER